MDQTFARNERSVKRSQTWGHALYVELRFRRLTGELALPQLVERFHSYLQTGGVLFSILREPHITTGVETRWWFESLTILGSSDTSQKPFPYPALTNREMERLFPGGNVKTFLTRSGRREVLGVK